MFLKNIKSVYPPPPLIRHCWRDLHLKSGSKTNGAQTDQIAMKQ